MGSFRAGVDRWFREVIDGEHSIEPAVLIGVLVAVASWWVGTRRGDVTVDIGLASVATFLYGVLLAFTIVRTRERLALVQDLISKSNSCLLSLHQMVEIFSPEERTRIRGLIDRHLTDQIDYRLVDNHITMPSFVALTEGVFALAPTTRQQELLYREVSRVAIEMTEYRSLTESSVGQSLSSLEWVSLLLLLVVLLGLIAVLPGGSIFGAVIAGVLAGTLVSLMALLRKLDLLRWHERVSIWEPTTRIFRSMGLDPYVPRMVIDGGRYLPTGRVRVVDYPDPYPNRSTKVVTLEEMGENGARV
ncbi:MAG: hypothetical protein WB565_16950 [Acidimicrobiales bacterium]